MCSTLRWTFALTTQGAVAPAMVLLDMEAAFPSLSHSFIRRCVRRFGGDHPAAQVIIDMYTNAATTILVIGEEFDGFEITGGVRQGCPLSDSTFVLCFHISLREIDVQISADHLRMPIKLRLYAFATAWPSSPSIWIAVQLLRRLLASRPRHI